MIDAPRTDPLARLAASVATLRSTADDAMGRIGTAVRAPGCRYARFLVKTVGEALEQVGSVVARLEAVRDVGWAAAARPALFRARCRSEEARWGAGVVVDEWPRPLQPALALPTDQVVAVAAAIGVAATELGTTLSIVTAGALTQDNAARLMMGVARFVLSLGEILSMVEEVADDDGDDERSVKVVDVRDRILAARLELLVAAAAVRSPGDVAEDRPAVEEVRGRVVMVGRSMLHVNAPVVAGVEDWLDTGRVRAVAYGVHALDAIVGHVWLEGGNEAKVALARERLARAATVLGFVADDEVIGTTARPIPAAWDAWQDAISGLADAALDGATVAYREAGRTGGREQLIAWFREVLEAVYAILRCLAMIRGSVQGARARALMAQVADGLIGASSALEGHIQRAVLEPGK